MRFISCLLSYSLYIKSHTSSSTNHLPAPACFHSDAWCLIRTLEIVVQGRFDRDSGGGIIGDIY